jgi:hypothetical protein
VYQVHRNLLLNSYLGLRPLKLTLPVPVLGEFDAVLLAVLMDGIFWFLKFYRSAMILMA